METTFEDEAGIVVRRKTKWLERIGVVIGAIALVLGASGGITANAEPTGQGMDMTQIEQNHILSQLVFGGLSRFLNGDGGGQGYEGNDVSADFKACPECGRVMGIDELEPHARVQHPLEYFSRIDDGRSWRDWINEGKPEGQK